jgi:hypothetical protein
VARNFFHQAKQARVAALPMHLLRRHWPASASQCRLSTSKKRYFFANKNKRKDMIH